MSDPGPRFGLFPSHSEVALAIADAANEIKMITAHTALRAKFTATIGAAADVERLAQSISASAAKRVDAVEPRLRLGVATADGGRKLQSRDMVEAEAAGISPELDSPTSNLYSIEPRVGLLTEAASDDRVEKNQAEAKIASHILQLHDRLGGFTEHCFFKRQPPAE